MKLWNSIMSGLLLAPLAGCPSDDTGQEGSESSTGDDTTSTTGDDTTGGSTAVDSTTGEPETTGATADCQEERPLPEAPAIDCSGASTVHMGSLILEEGSEDTSIFDGVVEVTGSILVNTTQVTNLDFMACVQRVGGEITIFDNDQLTNVDGLYNITELGTDFVLSGNDMLEDFNGLPQLEQTDGSIVIRENASLRTITGFHSFVGLNGMGTDPVSGEVIGGNLTIQENPLLESIDGLGQVRVVNGRVQITNNPELCISSVICVVTGIVQPAEPPDSWSTANNNGGC